MFIYILDFDMFIVYKEVVKVDVIYKEDFVVFGLM